ncbi:MFS transporter [Streptomyces olivoreticuli]
MSDSHADDVVVSTAPGQPSEPLGPPPYTWRWVALWVILAGEAMDMLDALVANIAAPSIRAELGGGTSVTQWLGAAYALAMAVGLITGGRLGDVVGRRRMFLVGVSGFTVASLLCAAAQSPGVLIGSRGLQGLFGAVMIPQGLGLIKEMFHGREAGKAFGAHAARLIVRTTGSLGLVRAEFGVIGVIVAFGRGPAVGEIASQQFSHFKRVVQVHIRIHIP